MGTLAFLCESPSKHFAPVPDAPVSDHLRIVPVGVLDMATEGELLAAVTDGLVLHRPRQIDLDLAEIALLAASGVSTLIRCRLKAAESGCRLVVLNPQPIVRQVLRITGSLEALGVMPPVVDADLEGLSAGRRSPADDPVRTRLNARAPEATDSMPRRTFANPTAVQARRDAAAVAEVARQIRERAAAMIRDNDARRARIGAAWVRSDVSVPSGPAPSVAGPVLELPAFHQIDGDVGEPGV